MSLRKPTIKEKFMQKFNDLFGEAPLDSYSRKLAAKYDAEVAAVTVPQELDS